MLLTGYRQRLSTLPTRLISKVESRKKIRLSVEQRIFKIDIMKEFDGKVARVTGGGSGIGRATAIAFAREGAQVIIGNRNVQLGEETVSMIRDAGGTASFQRT